MDEASEQSWAAWVTHQFVRAGIATTTSQHQATVRSLVRLESQMVNVDPQGQPPQVSGSALGTTHES